MIQFKHISKIYNKGKEDEVAALSNLNLNINKGEFVVIIGTNGSGKSTMLNTIDSLNELLHPFSFITIAA